MRLAIVSSHPVQYYAPLFRELTRKVDLHVFYAHRASGSDQARAGFGREFEWDVDLTSGYSATFVPNVSCRPGTDRFGGCDTPGIGRLLSEGRFDAVLVTGWHLKSYLQALIAAKRARIPVAVRGDSHLGTPRKLAKQWAKALAYPPFLRLFDAALYVGERSRAYYRHYGYPDERLHFSPHCVDNDWFAERATESARAKLRESLGIDQSAHVIMFAGKLVPFKRPLDLVAAAAHFRAQGGDLEVIVTGDGELRSEIKAAAEATGVPLHLLGFCNQSRMPAAYAAADCLVLPSNGQETWGLVVNEALACRRPVIVSDACGCAPDLAADGNVGRQYPCGDVAVLSESVAELLRSPPHPNSIAALSSSHSLSEACGGIVGALVDILERRGAVHVGR